MSDAIMIRRRMDALARLRVDVEIGNQPRVADVALMLKLLDDSLQELGLRLLIEQGRADQETVQEDDNGTQRGGSASLWNSGSAERLASPRSAAQFDIYNVQMVAGNGMHAWRYVFKCTAPDIDDVLAKLVDHAFDADLTAIHGVNCVLAPVTELHVTADGAEVSNGQH